MPTRGVWEHVSPEKFGLSDLLRAIFSGSRPAAASPYHAIHYSVTSSLICDVKTSHVLRNAHEQLVIIRRALWRERPRELTRVS